MKPSDVIANPANWIKGPSNYASNFGPCCMMGAVVRVSGHGTQKHNEARARLMKHLNVAALAEWNDAPERTHSEVIAALKACDL